MMLNILHVFINHLDILFYVVSIHSLLLKIGLPFFFLSVCRTFHILWIQVLLDILITEVLNFNEPKVFYVFI